MMNEDFGVPCVLAQVDGEVFNVIDAEATNWADVLSPSDAMSKWVMWAARFAAEYPQFRLAFRLIGPRGRRLWVMLMYIDGQPRRGQMEQVVCNNCGCAALIANRRWLTSCRGRETWRPRSAILEPDGMTRLATARS